MAPPTGWHDRVERCLSPPCVPQRVIVIFRVSHWTPIQGIRGEERGDREAWEKMLRSFRKISLEHSSFSPISFIHSFGHRGKNTCGHSLEPWGTPQDVQHACMYVCMHACYKVIKTSFSFLHCMTRSAQLRSILFLLAWQCRNPIFTKRECSFNWPYKYIASTVVAKETR